MKNISTISFWMICLFLWQIQPMFAQTTIETYPPNWWVGMKWNKVQILVYGKNQNFENYEVNLKYKGVTLDKIHRLENPKYLALDVSIAPDAQPGKVNIQLTPKKGKSETITWQLNSRREGNGTSFAQGVTSEDFIYLLMPDRFSNGNPTNDRIKGMRDQSLDRDSIFLRHGGDLQGVINHLDYLQQLGVTALWMTPALENDMPTRTEHGYACTNHYKIDPRQGSNDTYKKLSDALHQRGMKLVQDAVYNHIGSYHFTFLDLPMRDWVHQWDTYTNTTYKDQSLMDVHGSEKDRKLMTDGWFVPTMPDLNQQNPYVANYLIQHALWSVEEFGVDGWRIDTYIYNDLEFMNRCNQALLNEYPKISMFGETWVHGVLNQAYFVDNNLSIPFKSNLPGVTDFQTNLYGIGNALNEPFGWTEGVNKLYSTLSNDFVYKNPMNQVIFLDNHDKTRFFTYIKEDMNKYKMGIAWLLTCRGIPQLYYGTEVLMTGDTYPFDGYVRLDFPGGWQGDKVSGFTQDGLSASQIEAQNYVKAMANYRKNSSAIKTGKMMQFVPKDGVYVYFRYDADQTVMCIMNTADTAKELVFSDFSERTEGFTQAQNVVNNTEVYDMGQKLSLPAKTMLALELKK